MFMASSLLYTCSLCLNNNHYQRLIHKNSLFTQICLHQIPPRLRVFVKKVKFRPKYILKYARKRKFPPRKEYSGKFNSGVSPELHAEVVDITAAEGKCLNQCVADTDNTPSKVINPM